MYECTILVINIERPEINSCSSAVTCSIYLACSEANLHRNTVLCLYNGEYTPLLYRLYVHGLPDSHMTTRGCQSPATQCSKQRAMFSCSLVNYTRQILVVSTTQCRLGHWQATIMTFCLLLLLLIFLFSWSTAPEEVRRRCR